MEKEKVKEIKECLQNCINDCGATSCPYDKYEKGLKCIEDLQKDALKLINELESENERLSSRYRNLEINYNDTWEHYREYEVENQQLKDRIAELKSENERLSKELDSEWKDRRKAEEDLHKAQWNYKIGLGQSQSVNKKLKDRIAELEKENARLEKVVKHNQELIENGKLISSKQLPQFTEMLKEKVKDYEALTYKNNEVTYHNLELDIDETLKEFLR